MSSPGMHCIADMYTSARFCVNQCADFIPVGILLISLSIPPIRFIMFPVPARTISPTTWGSKGSKRALIEFGNLSACFGILASGVRRV